MIESIAYCVNVIGHVLRLDPAVFQALQFSENNLRLALSIILFAGLSSQVGHSVVLFANQIKPPRFIFSLLVGAAFYFINILLWSLSIWLLGRVLFDQVSFLQIINVMGLAQAPYVLSFLIFIPFFGIPIGWMLSLYTLIAVLTGLEVALDIPLGLAALTSGIGWLLVQLFQRTIGQPLTTLSHYVKTRVAGLDQLRQSIDAHYLIEQVEDRIEQESTPLI
jgi:Yip1 domain